jgi:hypothetical protein
MSFDLARTPTLEAVATNDEQALAEDLHKRVDEAVAAADANEEVAEACEAHLQAENRLTRLRKGERALTLYARESRDQMAAAEGAAMDAMIEWASAGKKIDFRKLDALAGIEHQNKLATRAIERMVEHMIPLAQIASLRAESHALIAKARAVEQIAQERAEKVLGVLRDAVSEEMVLPVDMSKGVAGALIAHAAALRRCAVQISESADEIERGYQKRSGLEKGGK